MRHEGIDMEAPFVCSEIELPLVASARRRDHPAVAPAIKKPVERDGIARPRPCMPSVSFMFARP